MKNNKLYGAAMLADEIGVISQKLNLAKNVMNDIMEERIPKSRIDSTTHELVIDAYKELSWKLDIASDYLLCVYEYVKKLEKYVDEYYESGEKFLFDVVMLCHEAAENDKGIIGISSKKILSVLGKEDTSKSGQAV